MASKVEVEIARVLRGIERQLERMELKIDLGLKVEVKQMANFEALTAAVTENTTVGDSVVTLLERLAQMVGETAPTQEAIDALEAQIRANTQKLADAVSAHTPAETPPA